jgi:hypothetical protein
MPGEADHFLGNAIKHRQNASKMEELPYVNTISVTGRQRRTFAEKEQENSEEVYPTSSDSCSNVSCPLFGRK